MQDDISYTERRISVSRTARVGTIGGFGPATTDVWLALHGYGHLASSFAASARWPQRPGVAYLFPEALQRFYDAPPGSSHADAPVGATWMTREARDDDIADNHGYLDALRADVRRAAPGARVALLGFSQGGALAARWAERCIRQADPLARLVIWGAPLPPDIDIGPGAPLRAMTVELVIGTRDRWATPERVSAERARLEAAKFPVTLVTFEGGHRLDDATLERVIAG